MTFSTFLFWMLALFTGTAAVMVVVTQHIVRMAAWLLFALGGTAGIFFLLGADFVGATQLIVYVGGVLVLVVFGVMLTAQGPFVSMKTGAAEWAISGLVGLVFFGMLATCLVLATWPSASAVAEQDEAKSSTSTHLGLSFLGIREATPEAKLPPPIKPGQPRQRMGYFLPFEIVSVHLVVVLIGAAYLARAKRRRGTMA